ncbi:hypothetical protein LAZ40_09510 [Cereibacter sphaeroides]|uniref:hypothetical protein n=1 Tax=Cereibacter sphaeroides TaxID=1063 RepID=UPI001F2B07EF|nr:hypothetical protein [Cereibacter sphaeroides]MCE6959289.1 hypothetical protein [Cereibacter sphaeroides]MCE6972881.1 hypothetical protein [Cereibacter sphaeroides]
MDWLSDRARDRVEGILLAKTGCGGFDGGCLAFARALQRHAGGEVVVLTRRDKDLADHAALLWNGLVADLDGPLPWQAFRERFEWNERVRIGGLRPWQSGDLPDAPCPPDLVSQLAAILRDEAPQLAAADSPGFADRPPEDRAVALRAFAGLADAQRGVPEILATVVGANPGLHRATGIFTWLAEHVGDLTHRMSEPSCEKWNFGHEFVGPKVHRALDILRNPASGAREIAGNLESNHRYARERGRFDGGFSDWMSGFREGVAAYAAAHAELTVWNEAQYHAREAAVALGELRYGDLRTHLERLEGPLLAGPATWTSWAGSFMIGADRELVAWCPASRTVAREPEEDPVPSS